MRYSRTAGVICQVDKLAELAKQLAECNPTSLPYLVCEGLQKEYAFYAWYDLYIEHQYSFCSLFGDYHYQYPK